MGASMQPVFNNFVRFVTINHELARKRRRFSIPPGLKSDSINLHYRHFIRYFFFGNSWICLFYLGGSGLLALGFILQFCSHYYLYHLLSLFWVEERFKKNVQNPHNEQNRIKNMGYLLGLSN
jgi:hypothetical protein